MWYSSKVIASYLSLRCPLLFQSSYNSAHLSALSLSYFSRWSVVRKYLLDLTVLHCSFLVVSVYMFQLCRRKLSRFVRSSHNLFSSAALLTVEIAAKYPLFSLFENIAGSALRSDIVKVIARGVVSSACEVSGLYAAGVVCSATGEAGTVSVCVCC